jgi:UDP-2,3-diacylglucosamine hydrolase
MIKDSTYFISDAHFGISLEGHDNREDHFFKLLNDLSGSMKALYVVGDLFDFWIEYRNAIRPDYFRVLYHLRKLVESGVQVHYLAGNHDFALGSFLTDTIGVSVYTGHLKIEIQGKKVHLYHGDGLIKKDVGYRILKSLLRNPFNQRLYRMLHPNFGVPFGSFCSGSSRKYLGHRNVDPVILEYRNCAMSFLEQGSDIVIFGHSHHPEIVKGPPGIYCNTGAWLKHYTFASMENGTIRLWSYKPGETLQELELIDLKSGKSVS